MDLRLSPRYYQSDADKRVKQDYDRGFRRLIVELPTGTGKTLVIVLVVRGRAGRAMILAHRDELIDQTAKKFQMVLPNSQIGIVRGKQNEIDAPILIASAQTLSRDDRLAQIPQDLSTIAIDECHHAASPTFVKILERAGAFTKPDLLTLGLTATVQRHDGVSLRGVFERISYRREILEMINEGFLVDIRAKRVALEVDFSDVPTEDGDFVRAEVGARLMKADAPEAIVRAYREFALNKKTIVFTPTVAVARAVAQAFRDSNFPADFVDGDIPIAARRRAISRFRSGETLVLCNCAVLTEGFDEPSVECIVVSRITRSSSLLKQMIGRGLRPFPNKEYLLVLDVVGATSDANIQTISSIFGLEPDELENYSVQQATLLRNAVQRVASSTARRGKDSSDARAHADGRLVSYDVDVFSAHKRLNWLTAKDGKRVLAVPGGAVYIAHSGKGYSVYHRRIQAAPTLLIDGLSESYAIGAAEDTARQLGAAPLVDLKAKWRSRPESLVQKARLRRLGYRRNDNIVLTQGQASDIITVLETFSD